MWDGGVAGESGRGCWGTWGVRRGVSGVGFGRVWGCVYMGGMRECMGYGGCLGVWVGKGCPGGWQGGEYGRESVSKGGVWGNVHGGVQGGGGVCVLLAGCTWLCMGSCTWGLVCVGVYGIVLWKRHMAPCL